MSVKSENNKNNAIIQSNFSFRAPIASLECIEESCLSSDGSLSTNPPSRQISVTAPPGVKWRNIGKSGLRISNIGLGAWVTFGSGISEETAEDIVTIAYENGINVFDTADIYAGGKAEEALGRILKKKDWKRSSYIVMTKLFWGGNKGETERGLSRKCIIEGLQASLDRLQLDYVDIVLCNKMDSMCPMEEIVRAFTYCISQGMAMYWGTSRFTAVEIMEAYSNARQFNCIPPIVEQTEYHMFQREKVEIHMPEVFHKIGVGTMCWSPQGFGILTGKFDEGIHHLSRGSIRSFTPMQEKGSSEESRSPKHHTKLQALSYISEKLGCTITQLTIAWCLKTESVNCVLVGASSAEQMYDHLQALTMLPRLSNQVMNEIEKVLDNKPIRQPPLR